MTSHTPKKRVNCALTSQYRCMTKLTGSSQVSTETPAAAGGALASWRCLITPVRRVDTSQRRSAFLSACSEFWLLVDFIL